MCRRCDETKGVIDHAVVAALKLARLTLRSMQVGFIGEALVITPQTSGMLDTVAVVVHADSTAAELKTQVKAFMQDLARLSAAHGVDVTAAAVELSPNLN